MLLIGFAGAVLSAALMLVLVLRWAHRDTYDLHDIWADDDNDDL